MLASLGTRDIRDVPDRRCPELRPHRRPDPHGEVLGPCKGRGPPGV